MPHIQPTGWYSEATAALPKGCRYCVRGEKLVLFITGLCSQKCFYCPISEEKKNNDVIFANERRASEITTVIEEAEACAAKGAGITGGDPLMRIERTRDMITGLKKRFGKRFHIHLYTPLTLVTKERLRELNDAGLDEIRFHPDLSDESTWENIHLAKAYNWDIGIEIPVIPDMEKQTRTLIERSADDIHFLNLNEFEVSDTNAQEMDERSYHTYDELTYAIEGSGDLARRLMQDYGGSIPTIHFCTAQLKDKAQMTNRIRRRAEHIARPYDKVNEEGLLLRGAVYSPSLVPGVGYREKIRELPQDERDGIIEELKRIRQELRSKLSIPERFVEVDTQKLRILTRKALIKKIAKKFPYPAAIVEEYPTWDRFEVELEFIRPPQKDSQE